MANCAVIKDTIRIEDIIGRVVALKRHGSWYLGRCPFHDDRHPSLVVWPRTGTWKCMACSPMRDDVIGFVVRWRQCSVADALQWLNQESPVWDTPARVAPPSASSSASLAPLAVRDATYRALLHSWGLTARHRQALLARGLSSRAIFRADLATVTPGDTSVMPETDGVPGLARGGTPWRVVGPVGLAIPVRNPDGLIQALHVRVDHATVGKYRWLSTPAFPGGAASGAPVHVARGVDDVVWITEGPLKAIVAQERLRHTVLGVPGIAAWSSVLDIVAQLRPQRIVLAFDQDSETDTAVRVAQQTARLHQALTAAGWDVWQARWTGPKGLDDAVVAGSRIAFQRLP